MDKLLKNSLQRKTASYIEYLKNEHSLDISVHLKDDYSYMIFDGEELIKYNTHTNPYCFYVKSDSLKHRKCLKCQAMATSKCRDNERYIGVCHAGVREYVYRISLKGEAVGFVSVSGYRDKSTEEYVNNWYDDNLRKEDIPISLLDSVIPPLCIMIENLISCTPGNNDDDDVYLRILSYLSEHHSDTSVDVLSTKFNYSKSYISHMFRKKSGYTLKSYCNLLKIQDAKLLLEETRMSVTEVALSVGFNNFSYFINVFKNMTGTTPLAWRKNYCRECENI